MTILQLQLLLQMSLLNMAYQPVNQLNVYEYESNNKIDMLNQYSSTNYCQLDEVPCTKFIVCRENQAPLLQFSKKI